MLCYDLTRCFIGGKTTYGSKDTITHLSSSFKLYSSEQFETENHCYIMVEIGATAYNEKPNKQIALKAAIVA